MRDTTRKSDKHELIRLVSRTILCRIFLTVYFNKIGFGHKISLFFTPGKFYEIILRVFFGKFNLAHNNTIWAWKWKEKIFNAKLRVFKFSHESDVCEKTIYFYPVGAQNLRSTIFLKHLPWHCYFLGVLSDHHVVSEKVGAFFARELFYLASLCT